MESEAVGKVIEILADDREKNICVGISTMDALAISNFLKLLMIYQETDFGAPMTDVEMRESLAASLLFRMNQTMSGATVEGVVPMVVDINYRELEQLGSLIKSEAGEMKSWVGNAYLSLIKSYTAVSGVNVSQLSRLVREASE